MFAARFEPLSEMNRLSNELDRLFSRNDGTQRRSSRVGAFPALNVWEDENQLIAEAELPGFAMEELEIYVTGNQLTLKGERRPPEQASGTWHHRERAFGKFSRTVELVADVDAKKVSATLGNGILKITLPKSEAVKPHRIKVNAR